MGEEKTKPEKHTEHADKTNFSEEPLTAKKNWKFYLALAVFAGMSILLAYISKKLSAPLPGINHTTLGGGCPTCGLG